MIFGESPLKDVYRRVVWGPGRHALNLLPSPWEVRVVRGAGRVAAAVLADKRARIRENLARAFPDRPSSELDGIARAAFAAHFSNQYISFTFPRCTADNWQRYLAFEGLERLERARARGRGVVLAHPHMGPAQLPLHVLGLLGFPMHQVGGGEIKLVELSPTGRWAKETRGRLERSIAATLYDGKRYLRPLLRVLWEGGIVMTACDATGGGEELGRRVVCTVLGQRMGIPVGPVWMALRSGAELLTLRCHRNPSAGAAFIAEVGEELALDRSAPLRAALEAGAQRLARYVDESLTRWPGDWLFWDGFTPGGLLVEEPDPSAEHQ